MAKKMDWKSEATELRKKVKQLEKLINQEVIEKAEIEDGKSTINAISINGKFALHPSLSGWFFNKDNVLVGKRSEKIQQALGIGMLALWQGRVSHSLNQFKDKMQSEIELVQMYMLDLEKKLEKDNKYKTDQEITIKVALEKYVRSQGYLDDIQHDGTGSDDDDTNKTGDVLAIISDGKNVENLAIEVKFSSTYGLGDIETGGRNNPKNSFRSQGDTAFGQLLETRSTKKSNISIFVMNERLNPINEIGDQQILFYPEVFGFIVKVDSENNNFTYLEIAYEIARTMTLASRPLDKLHFDVIQFLLTELNFLLKRDKHYKGIAKTIRENIISSHNTLLKTIDNDVALLDAEISALNLAVNKTMNVLENYLETGVLEPDEAWAIYSREREQMEWAQKKAETKEWMTLASNLSKPEDTPIETAKDSSEPKKTKPTEMNLKDLKKAELVELCVEKGLAKSGTKDQLIARLNE
ncbi:SAP domain-containing protein [Euryarchaeota archaeon]|nr:SAP domain-containing protein [Euryarchaeota archaeon]MDA8610569.1 SAP domain-containing protein [Euryarchaeota archaeon]